MHSFTRRTVLIALTFTLMLSGSRDAFAQIKTAESDGIVRYGEAQVTRYRVGLTVTAKAGPVQKIVGMVAVPFPCDEQDVQIAEEDISPEIGSVDYRFLDGGGARQMVVTIPYLAGGAEARAIVTFNVTTRTILPPEDTDQFVIPARPDRPIRRYLGRSPMIETKHSKIRQMLREALAEDEPSDDTEDSATDPAEADRTDWQVVEAIYDHVLQSVEYLEGEDKSAVQTIEDGTGDCHNISALFVALCRTHSIPARMVWVHEHQYAEFALEDGEGKLHWFPVESSGTRAFGEMPIARTIMQKGDNFTVPERPRDRLRYASDFLIGVPVPGSGKPRVRYIREQL